ncbi:Polysulphide reductase NrfD [Nitrosococcus halophilus Nc 4]|uniref:Polysulphide reductase NrfD n=1 Tax=Nitrosococcus halophilus (strain Nc4) TaxID=472759 RepID=D5BWM4_NITHN|nr:NrfD/PsrC family molybdoenzyme membrane anchor subunit [Nitrosococcus halophilus]ADE15681.1 Polysulphide reductase NrfD [Nitrosococcus halophilus Nc 4]
MPTESSNAEVGDKVSDLILIPQRRWLWHGAFGISAVLSVLFFLAIGYLFVVGVGIWGINIPVAWGFAITNYVWWIGIGMAGTFISAALLLFRQQWRTSISRSAEAMTVFAVAIAALFPLLHLGRPWFAYWLAPYPDTMNIWPQWRSALVWDFFAIFSYLIVSVLFWYVGMIPDLACLRDRARKRPAQIFYGLLALGWRGEARHWRRYQMASLLLAGLAVTLVFSVHSMVALAFAEGNTPGWHSTIFPPFFVVGALFSGFAMVLMLVIPVRAIFGLQDFITAQHLDSMAKVLLAVGLIITYSYVIEVFMAWYSANPYEIYTMQNRMVGAYAPLYWGMIFCNVLVLQALWFKRVRLNSIALFLVGTAVVVGMWLERFMLIVTSLHRDFLPSAWGMFSPTLWDWIILVGSMGFFAMLFLLFVRFLPVVSIFEIRRATSGTEKK